MIMRLFSLLAKLGDRRGDIGPHGYPIVMSAMGTWMEEIPEPTNEDMAAYYARDKIKVNEG